MEPLIKELLEVITQEVKSLESFLALLTDQENLLINHRHSSLSRFYENQRDALSSAKSLEKKRLLITHKLSKKFKIDRNKFNLSLLSELLEESCCTRLEELQRILLDLYNKVDLQRKKNRKLIKESSGLLIRRKETDPHKLVAAEHPIRTNPGEEKISFESLSKKVVAN